jgi:hypothetical protein
MCTLCGARATLSGFEKEVSEQQSKDNMDNDARRYRHPGS